MGLSRRDRVKYALLRFARAIAAAVVAAAVTQLPELGEELPEAQWSVPAIASLLLALDKYLRSGK